MKNYLVPFPVRREEGGLKELKKKLKKEEDNARKKEF